LLITRKEGNAKASKTGGKKGDGHAKGSIPSPRKKKEYESSAKRAIKGGLLKG